MKKIQGMIKLRASDFIVEEITLDGKVCKCSRYLDGRNNERAEIKVPEKPEDCDQLILEVEKFNCDTTMAFKKLSRYLQTSLKRIGFAGMKDKRGITCQQVSLWEPNVARVESFNANNLDLRNPVWSKKRLELGDLKGNHFTITIRKINLKEEEIKERFEENFKEINENGLANYFGSQRFGGLRIISHLVGKEIIKGNFEEAVKIYLTFSSDREDGDVKAARDNLAGDWPNMDRANEQFPNRQTIEHAIINHLKRPGMKDDWKGSLQALPKYLRILFVHAYQSYLFNEIIKERIKEFGLKQIEGDVLDESGIPTIQLFGFQSKFSEGKIGEIEKRVLEREGINFQNFYVKESTELSSKGSKKAMIVKPEGFKLISIENDEFNEGFLKAKIEFDLDKGNYATTVLDEMVERPPKEIHQETT